jgi:hypothetical protein
MESIFVDIDLLKRLIEVDCLTHPEVARILKCSRTTIGRLCRKHNLKTQRTGPRAGDRHPDWKGGRVKLGGYWYIYSPEHPGRTKQRRVAEHRLVVEKHIGRYLTRKEVVHHIDGNPENNDISNLVLFSNNGEHLKTELLGRCPKWTEEGKRRISEGIRKAASRRKLKVCDRQNIQTTVHQTSRP